MLLNDSQEEDVTEAAELKLEGGGGREMTEIRSGKYFFFFLSERSKLDVGMNNNFVNSGVVSVLRGVQLELH